MSSFTQSLAQSRSSLDRSAAWFLDTVREELKPYPGRGQVVVRMVLSSVVVMLLVMTFRIPGAALAGYYTLLLSRESPRSTLAGAVELVVSFGAGVAYVMLSAQLFFGSPVLHLLWVVVTLFFIFFVMRVLRSYSAAAGFGFLIATCIPIWDRTIPGENALEATLWTAANVTLAAVVTVLIEYLFANLRRFGDLEEGLAERWEALEQALLGWGNGAPVAETPQLHQFATVGVSRLRRIMIRSGATTEWIERMGTIVALTEHLIDLTAALAHIDIQPASEECRRLQRAAEHLRHLRLQFLGKIPPPPESAHAHPVSPAPCPMPLLPGIERTINMLNEAVQGRAEPLPTALPRSEKSSFLVKDAFTNPAHLRFALQGCLAASACYLVYNAIGWPGLNTSVATCIVTALSSVGSSRQKQLLRVGGAIVGGFVFGMGAQISILTGMDSITAFTIYFAVVTAIAAWFSTSSARLSYFGLQLALAFFLINLQEPAFQTSLAIARDRVLGILLGLFFMWLVFDLFTGIRAAQEMLKRFHRAIQLVANLQELSLAEDADAIAIQAGRIREDLIGTFAAMNTEADAILFETGRDREKDIALRARILAVQPTLRSLLLLQVTALQYRRQRLIHELPPVLATAQRSFDETVSACLRHLSDQTNPRPQLSPEDAFRNLNDRVHAYYREVAGGTLPHRSEAILALSDSIASSVHSLREAVVA